MATTVRALSGDAELLERLTATPFAATVHSVFDRVANLRLPHDGQLCTVATVGIDNAPATLVVDTPTVRTLRLQVGDTVTSHRARLLFPGGRVVDVRGTAAWRPHLPPLPVPAPSRTWLNDFIGREGIGGGAKHPAPQSDSWESAVAAQVAGQLAALLGGIRSGAHAVVTDSAARLVGLGPGLTPTGDDVLLGVMLVAAMPQSTLAPARRPLARAVDDCATQTTEVSRAALAQAARGRTRQRIIGLLDAMACGETASELDRHGRLVTAIGHTSGTDILVGISAAMTLESELRGER